MLFSNLRLLISSVSFFSCSFMRSLSNYRSSKSYFIASNYFITASSYAFLNFSCPFLISCPYIFLTYSSTSCASLFSKFDICCSSFISCSFCDCFSFSFSEISSFSFSSNSYFWSSSALDIAFLNPSSAISDVFFCWSKVLSISLCSAATWS